MGLAKDKIETQNGHQGQVLELFLNNLALHVLKMKNAYLLHELLDDLNSYCNDFGLATIWKSTKSLRNKLEEKFGDNIAFNPNGFCVIVHSSTMQPCDYSLSTIKGCGLRDSDYVLPFGNFIRKKNARSKEN